MRRAWCAGVLAAVVAPVLARQAVAFAELPELQRTLAVDAAAWSWRKVTPAGLPAGEPSHVPDGGLAVQFDGRPGAPPAKATYLRLALGDLPTGTTALGLTLVLSLDPGQNAPGPMVACPLAAPFVTGAGVDPAQQPAEDCAGAPAASYDLIGKTLAFDLTAQVNRWLSGMTNHGIVVRPDPAVAFPDAFPYQVTITGPATIRGLLSARLPAAPMTTAPPRAPLPVPVPVPDPGYVSAPRMGAPVAAPQSAPAPVQPPVIAPRPAVAMPVALPGLIGRAAGLASPSGLAAGALLGLVLLAVVGWSLGDAADPRAFARAERRRRDRLAIGSLVRIGQPRQRRQGRKPVSSAASTVT